MRLPLSATQKRRDTPTVFWPSELPKAAPKLIIFQVWCAHGREYWGDGLSDVTPCILVNTNALEESVASILHPEAGDNTAFKKVDYYVLEVALSVQVEYPTHVVRLPGGSRSSSLLHIVQTGNGGTRPPVGSCSGVRSQPVITSDHCHWTRHYIPERRHSNWSSFLLLFFLLQ